MVFELPVAQSDLCDDGLIIAIEDDGTEVPFDVEEDTERGCFIAYVPEYHLHIFAEAFGLAE